MNVLVLGSGGREHTITRGLSQDPSVTGLHAAPGNPGMAALATCHSVDILDAEAVTKLATELSIDLVVVGPEAPLCAGVSDALRSSNINVFGPSQAAAMLEGSKHFAKEVMTAAGVPTGTSETCSTEAELKAALDAQTAPYVVKDDGLAGGKGVIVTEDIDAAFAHGAATVSKGKSVLVEEYLAGPEVSVFCVTDGKTVLPLAPAQDFKRALDGGKGPNTGGMGAYCPLPWVDADLAQEVVDKIAQPTVDEMARRGTPFSGLLYCGLVLTEQGVKVIEFNVRFGDPETQVVLPRLVSPLGELLNAAATGSLADFGPLQWLDEAAVTVVLASEGYPAAPQTGRELGGLGEDSDADHIIHAGTADKDGTLVASGGRILSPVGMGPTVEAARKVAYDRIGQITCEGSHYRSDIAHLG